MRIRRSRKPRKAKRARALHHVVYVVELKSQDGPGTSGLYVGMTGLTPAERFANHKAGVKCSHIVRDFGVRLAPEFYEHIHAMTWKDAVAKEKAWAEELRANGFRVYGGH